MLQCNKMRHKSFHLQKNGGKNNMYIKLIMIFGEKCLYVSRDNVQFKLSIYILNSTFTNDTGSSKISEIVAAHLRSLRADDPSSKRQPRPIKQKLELCQHQTYFRNY